MKRVARELEGGRDHRKVRREREGEREKGRRGLRYFRVKTLVFTLEEGEGGRVWIERIEKGGKEEKEKEEGKKE